MSIYKLLKQRSLLLLASLMLAFSAYSQIPSKPNPYRLINDFAGIFTSAQIEDLESIARNFRDSTSNEICIVTVKDLGDYDRSQFAYEIGQTWGVGDKKFDNGVVLLIVPKSKSANGQVFIATGYGLEGALPDIECSNIIRQILIPSFQRNDYYTGTRQALLKIGQIASGEYNEAIDEDNDISDIGIFIAIIFWIIIIIIIYFIF